MSNKMDRRSFLGRSARIGVGLVGGSVLLSACAGGDKSGKMTPLRQPGEYPSFLTRPLTEGNLRSE